MAVNLGLENGLNHGEVFQIIMRLEQCIACKELDKDATYAPYIARKRPS
jgi:hypothetical protein